MTVTGAARPYVTSAELMNCFLASAGRDFGREGAIVLVGTERCNLTTHDASTPHEKVRCTLPAGNRVDRPIIVFQASQRRLFACSKRCVRDLICSVTAKSARVKVCCPICSVHEASSSSGLPASTVPSAVSPTWLPRPLVRLVTR